MKNVLHIIGGLDRGGAESFLMNTIRNIDRSQYNIIVATFMPPVNGKKYAYQDELDKLNIKTIIIPDNRFKKPLKFISSIRELVKNQKIDIVHSHIDFMSALTLIGAKQGGAQKRIAHSHNTNNSQLVSLPKKIVAKFLRKVINMYATDRIACGHDAGRFLFGKRTPFVFIPNGINIKNFKFNKNARDKLRRTYKLTPHSTAILNVGRLEEQKNQLFLIDIFKNYQITNPNSYLFIIGDGSLFSKLQKKIHQLNLSKKIFLIPSLSNINEYYSLADFFLLPSLFEGVPIVGIEAQTSGLQCLFSNKTPKEASLSPNTKFLNISGPEAINIWTDNIQKSANNSSRVEANSQPAIQNYDISKTIIKLERIYATK